MFQHPRHRSISTPSSSSYRLLWNRRFLVQDNWQNFMGWACAIHWRRKGIRAKRGGMAVQIVCVDYHYRVWFDGTTNSRRFQQLIDCTMPKLLGKKGRWKKIVCNGVRLVTKCVWLWRVGCSNGSMQMYSDPHALIWTPSAREETAEDKGRIKGK